MVVMREEGPVLNAYKNLGINTIVKKDIPIYKPSSRNNIYVLSKFLMKFYFFLKSYKFLQQYIATHRIDIIHLNHDSFFVYGLLFRNIKNLKIVIHMRTMIPKNYFGILQGKIINKIAHHLIFISENEFKRFSELLGKGPNRFSIIYNIGEPFEIKESSSNAISLRTNMTKVIYLGNLTYNKGADRLLDIARVLKNNERNDVLFIICGEEREAKGKKRLNRIKTQARLEGLNEFFLFMGHQSPPEPILQQADILIRLSRWNDPWGRDIIEAMVHGKPIITTGTYNKFVEDRVNGYLFPEFDAEKIAEKIIYLSKNPEVIEKMGKANIEKAKKLFDGPTNAAKVMSIYESLIRGNDHAICKCRTNPSCSFHLIQ